MKTIKTMNKRVKKLAVITVVAGTMAAGSNISFADVWEDCFFACGGYGSTTSASTFATCYNACTY